MANICSFKKNNQLRILKTNYFTLNNTQFYISFGINLHGPMIEGYSVGQCCVNSAREEYLRDEIEVKTKTITCVSH